MAKDMISLFPKRGTPQKLFWIVVAFTLGISNCIEVWELLHKCHMNPRILTSKGPTDRDPQQSVADLRILDGLRMAGNIQRGF